MKLLKHILSILLVAVCMPLFAGIKIVTNSESFNCSETYSGGTTTMYLRSDIMRIDVKDDRADIGMIFKKSEQKMWVIDYKKKEYYTISKEDLDKVSERMADVRRQMDEKLKNLPEEQQKMMREMMTKNMGGMGETVERKYEEGSESKTVASWDCKQYLYFENDEKKQEQWVAARDQLNVSQEDFQILLDFSEFLKSNLEQFSFGASNSAVSAEKPYDGFPMQTDYYEDGKNCMTSKVTSVVNGDLEDALFKIPEGFKKHENPMKGN